MERVETGLRRDRKSLQTMGKSNVLSHIYQTGHEVSQSGATAFILKRWSPPRFLLSPAFCLQPPASSHLHVLYPKVPQQFHKLLYDTSTTCTLHIYSYHSSSSEYVCPPHTYIYCARHKVIETKFSICPYPHDQTTLQRTALGQ